MPHDLLLRSGHVLDPANGRDGVLNVAVADGRIARVAAGLDVGAAAQVVDVAGLYVTPGLIDIHVHVYPTAVRAGRAGSVRSSPTLTPSAPA